MAFDGIKVGALWKNKSGKGYSGSIDVDVFEKYLKENGTDNLRILVFKNDYKEEDKHPDLNLFFAPGNQTHTQPAGKGKQKPAGKAKSDEGSDDIPF